MSFKKSILEKVGGFDERFDISGSHSCREESDLCYRVSKYGLLIFAPKAVVRHLELGGKANPFWRACMTYYFLRKNNILRSRLHEMRFMVNAFLRGLYTDLEYWRGYRGCKKIMDVTEPNSWK